MKKMKLALLVALFVTTSVAAVSACTVEENHICTPECEEYGIAPLFIDVAPII